MYGDNTDGNWGVSHLASMPISLTFGSVLLGALIILIFLRVIFASVDVRGGVR